MDGEVVSNTAFFEQQRHWQGLLIEMNPFLYRQLRAKNRRVWSMNACLSPYNHFAMARFTYCHFVVVVVAAAAAVAVVFVVGNCFLFSAVKEFRKSVKI